MKLEDLNPSFVASNIKALESQGIKVPSDLCPVTPPTPLISRPRSRGGAGAPGGSPSPFLSSPKILDPKTQNPEKKPEKGDSESKKLGKKSQEKIPENIPRTSEEVREYMRSLEATGFKSEGLKVGPWITLSEFAQIVKKGKEMFGTCPAGSEEQKKIAVAGVVRFTIGTQPLGKPRQSQRDKWAKRPRVVRYRAWADLARASAPKILPVRPWRVDWIAYFAFPRSYSKKKRAALTGQLHDVKPDRDNIDKALLDALWKDDACVSVGCMEKRWDDGRGARLEVTVYAR